MFSYYLVKEIQINKFESKWQIICSITIIKKNNNNKKNKSWWNLSIIEIKFRRVDHFKFVWKKI